MIMKKKDSVLIFNLKIYVSIRYQNYPFYKNTYLFFLFFDDFVTKLQFSPSSTSILKLSGEVSFLLKKRQAF